MRYCTCRNTGWFRKTTATGLVPLLLAQFLIALLCVPDTLKAGAEIRREMTSEELRDFLSGQEKFTILLSEGGAVRGNGITVLADNIHLGRITRATDGKRHPNGSETSIAIGSVKEIRVEKMRGSLRRSGAVGFGLLGCWMGAGFALGDPPAIRNPAAGLTVWLGSIVGGAFLGHKLGKRKDRETTIIKIVD